jgi:hypothetical protein
LKSSYQPRRKLLESGIDWERSNGRIGNAQAFTSCFAGHSGHRIGSDARSRPGLAQKTFTTRTTWDRLPVKFSGPLFIVYPYDSRPELKDPVYRNRSAWQLKEIAFE